MSNTCTCKNNLRCWECKDNSCKMKLLFCLPEREFIRVLHDSYAPSIYFMTTKGIPLIQAEETQKIFTMSLIVARKKFLDSTL